MKQIPLVNKNGFITDYVVVDDRDYTKLSKLKWYKIRNGYAVHHSQKNGRQRFFYMHRLINKTPIGMHTDHIDRNKLDNRKYNLRTVTTAENGWNIPVRPMKSLSGLLGASPDGNGGYMARIKKNGIKIHLGCYKTAKEAHEVYMKAKQIRDSMIGNQ